MSVDRRRRVGTNGRTNLYIRDIISRTVELIEMKFESFNAIRER